MTLTGARGQAIAAAGAGTDVAKDIPVITKLTRVKIAITAEVRCRRNQRAAWATAGRKITGGKGIGALLHHIVAIITGLTLRWLRDAIAAKFRAGGAPCIAGGIHIGGD